MLWVCLTYEGLGYVCEIYDGIMKKEDYVCILQSTLEDTISHYGIDRKLMIFQHDNDPKHTAKLTEAYLASQEYSVLPWPAQSPDLNSIEHIWDHLKLKLAYSDTKAKGTHELWDRVLVEWETFSLETCRRYCESMPARVQAVLAAKGKHTKY
jgi:hypothetical protein